jgi:hypothetical protein
VMKPRTTLGKDVGAASADLLQQFTQRRLARGFTRIRPQRL